MKAQRWTNSKIIPHWSLGQSDQCEWQFVNEAEFEDEGVDFSKTFVFESVDN